MSNTFAKDYIDVAERIREFKKAFPTGSLQRVDLEFVNIGGKDFVVYTAAAYRSPDDERPGMGTAWEPVPGLTPYTKNSEVMVAETSAWGRAIVAALAGETKRIASADEVRNRPANVVNISQPVNLELKELSDLLTSRFKTKDERSTFVMDTLQLLDPKSAKDLNDNEIGVLLRELRKTKVDK
jgi:hypothetical protein